MAEALVSALVGTLIGNLNSAFLKEIGLHWGLQDDLQNLESVVRTIQLVLQDAEVKQRKNEALHHWLRKLKNAVYDAENILDQISTEGLRQRANSKMGMHRQFSSFFSRRNPLLFRLKIAGKVKNMRGRLDAIADERLKFHLEEGIVTNHVGELEGRQTSSLVSESEIYGREKEQDMLVDKLLDEINDRDDLSVYAIWGMGGIGKTTLAQLVHNDERVKRHFELRVWVCVSDDFSMQRLVRAILESIQGGGCSVSELDPLLRLLQEKLTRRKFLLVLDDVWNENERQWDGLREALKCGSKGSAVIVTTRIENVALMMATRRPIHRLGYLSEDDSWSLFKRIALENAEEERLVAIGEAIVKKCGGVPLAIKVLGSLMKSKRHENEWLATSEIWQLSDNESDILPILRLSYDNLSPQMRQCFAYCCIFPKDHEMNENELVQLWMANGFLHSEGQSNLLLTGQMIFKELAWRSFFQDVRKDYSGAVTCQMHDLMHDLAVSVMRNETYFVDHGIVPEIPATARHLSLNIESFGSINGGIKLPTGNSLRSLIVHEGYCREFDTRFSSFLSKQQYLRVLNVSLIEEFPEFVCKLEHLRFLEMDCSNLKRLPESITRLLNLQTLKLTESHSLLKLPKGLKYMKNLWFVEIGRFDSLICTPPGLGELTSLQRLRIFIVGKDSAHHINQLKELNLGGELTIQGLENLMNSEDAKSANLINKKNLTSLILCWTNNTNENLGEHLEEILEGLQPHQNLEKLCIESYQGSGFPNWMSTVKYNCLTEVTLKSCRRCEHLPPLGKLPALNVLHLYDLESIQRLHAEWYGDGESSFAQLLELTICGMPNLQEWTTLNSQTSFLCLQKLRIKECPKLTGLPFLPALTVMETEINEIVIKSMMLPSLTSILLDGSAHEISIPPGGLSSDFKNIEHLHISCHNLKTLSNLLDNLWTLKSLYINCPNLESFPAAVLENLTSLRSLSFIGCNKLDLLSGPLQAVTTVEDLYIDHCSELEYLPESIQQLTALKNLRIYLCERLCSTKLDRDSSVIVDSEDL